MRPTDLVNDLFSSTKRFEKRKKRKERALMDVKDLGL